MNFMSRSKRRYGGRTFSNTYLGNQVAKALLHNNFFEQVIS